MMGNLAKRSARLVIEVHSFWHVGTGRGSGSHLDALAHRDGDGLPVIPGRQLKGLLRDAVRQSLHWGRGGVKAADQGQVAPAGGAVVTVESLFGSASREGGWANSGVLRVSNGCLPENERAALRRLPNVVDALFDRQFHTAVDVSTGSALKKSLRGLEVVVPLTLHATLECLRHEQCDAVWAVIRDALPFVEAVGAHRARGFGRATLSLAEVGP